MKYIDADKLIAEIERRKKQDVTFRERSILIDIETAITSLQQDQPDYKEAVQLVFEEKLIPFKDGNQWCFLLGRNIQEGICGFGDTILDAAVAFYNDYTNTRIHIGELKISTTQQEQPEVQVIQWTGYNLKEVIDFTGKSPRFGEWFKSWEEFENYVHTHNDILKLFCEDGSHYEVPVGAWIVKTPDGYNVPSVAKYIQQEQPKKRLIQVKCLYPYDESWQKNKIYACEVWHHGDLNRDFWDVYYDYGKDPKYVQFPTIELLNEEFAIIQEESKVIPEQPEMELEKEYKSYMKSRKDDLSGNAVTVNVKDLARHFYELGQCNARKEE